MNYQQLTQKTITEQTDAFAHAFAIELTGAGIDAVLKTANAFAVVAPEGACSCADALKYYDMCGSPMTLKQLIDMLQGEDKTTVALVDVLLAENGKTIAQLFAQKKDNPLLVKLLDAAIAECRAATDEAAKRAFKIMKLETQKTKGGVKGRAAAAELAQLLAEDETAARRRAITAKAARKKLAAHIKADTKARNEAAEAAKCAAKENEQARVEAVKKSASNAKREAKKASRARLAARAAMFNGSK